MWVCLYTGVGEMGAEAIRHPQTFPHVPFWTRSQNLLISVEKCNINIVNEQRDGPSSPFIWQSFPWMSFSYIQACLLLTSISTSLVFKIPVAPNESSALNSSL